MIPIFKIWQIYNDNGGRKITYMITMVWDMTGVWQQRGSRYNRYDDKSSRYDRCITATGVEI
jgi:hypothetical protein